MSKKEKKQEKSKYQLEYDKLVLDIATKLGSAEEIAKLSRLFMLDSTTHVDGMDIKFSNGIFEKGFMGQTLEETAAHYVARKFMANELRDVMTTLVNALKPKEVEEKKEDKKESKYV